MAEDYMKLYQKALTGLQTGGKKLEAALAEIEEGKQQAIGRGQQALVSGGLGGTTVMGGVPLQAEKIAARQRLGARGQAEQTYLTTLASFAAFAQRGQEAARQREYETEQATTQRKFEARQAELGRIAATGTTQYGKPAAQQSSLAEFMRGFDVRGGGAVAGGGGYAEQFPTMYDQGGGQAPSLMGGAGAGVADTPWPTMAPLGGAAYGSQEAFETYGLEPPTGSVPMGKRTAPTIRDEPWSPTAGQFVGRDTSQEAYQAAKTAGRPWTYNYSTWKRAIASGKT